MTKPTVIIDKQYAIFRSDTPTLNTNVEYALRGTVYSSKPDADKALRKLSGELVFSIKGKIEVREMVTNPGYDDQAFGKNPLVAYN